MFRTRRSAQKVRNSVAPPSRPRPLRLEPLEDRLLLATRTWSGAGGDDNWNTAPKWAETAGPAAGAALVFPANAARLTNANNLAADTAFNSLTFNGTGYVISGNAIGLGAGGITTAAVGPSPAPNTLSLNIT